jgi:hypothetical protein
MMLIATGVAAVLLASAAPAVSTPSLPPVIVHVSTVPGVPATLVTRLLAETDEIWRASAIPFLWQRAARDIVATLRPMDTAPAPYLPSMLRVVIGDAAGVARDHRTPLGWITFDDERTPQREIYLSYANANVLLAASRSVVGGVERMPRLQREQLLGRAMGRALAHELGHYLLASKAHTTRGLLKASRTASELFAAERSGFQIDAAQRHLIGARLRGDSFVASR